MAPPRLHPVLFAIYPILYLWGENAQEGNASDALILLAIAVGLALALPTLLDRCAFGSLEKASVATTAGFFLFFSYGHTYTALYDAGYSIGRQRFLLPIFVALVIAAWAWLYGRPESPVTRPRLLNAMGLALVVLALSTLWVNRAPARGLTPPLEPDWIRAAESPPRPLPDLYYLILDGYGRGDVLAQNFDLDNSAFISSLEKRGFVVADRSRSNYSSTAPSLASSLNFGLLHGEGGLLAGEDPEPDMLKELVRNNRLFRLLARAGYSRLVIAPRENFVPSADPPEAIVNCGSSREFFEAFLHTTMARAVRSRWGGFTAGRRRETVRCQFDALAAAVGADGPNGSNGPKVVFFHSLVTHPPFLFHRDGSPREVRDAVARQFRPWRPRQQYVDQVLFTNGILLEVVDTIVGSSPDAVIVIQGDHGPAWSRDWGRDRAGDYRERFGILNAIRIPAASPGAVYADITPVNTFRTVLREVFGSAVEPLPDRSFMSDDLAPGGFVDATDLARPSPAPRSDRILSRAAQDPG